MTDNEADALEKITQRLDTIIRMMTTAVVPDPNTKLDQIIQKLEPMSKMVQEIHRKLMATEQAKTSPEPLPEPPITLP